MSLAPFLVVVLGIPAGMAAIIGLMTAGNERKSRVGPTDATHARGDQSTQFVERRTVARHGHRPCSPPIHSCCHLISQPRAGPADVGSRSFLGRGDVVQPRFGRENRTPNATPNRISSHCPRLPTDQTAGFHIGAGMRHLPS